MAPLSSGAGGVFLNGSAMACVFLLLAAASRHTATCGCGWLASVRGWMRTLVVPASTVATVNTGRPRWTETAARTRAAAPRIRGPRPPGCRKAGRAFIRGEHAGQPRPGQLAEPAPAGAGAALGAGRGARSTGRAGLAPREPVEVHQEAGVAGGARLFAVDGEQRRRAGTAASAQISAMSSGRVHSENASGHPGVSLSTRRTPGATSREKSKCLRSAPRAAAAAVATRRVFC